jgi:uncharacterized protein YndB with AHSA1/START domain
MPYTEESVALIRTIKAPSPKVFAAWTDGTEALTQLESLLGAA